MFYLTAVGLLGFMAVAQSASPNTNTNVTPPVSARNKVTIEIPRGKTTVMGGEIRDIDPVRDQFMLRVFGGHPVKIFFDERTKIYRNGKPVPTLDLRPDKHASVQTTLDGNSIFAVRINMISDMPDDQFRGRVTTYNDTTRRLTMVPNAEGQPITLSVPSGTPILNISQDGSSTPQSGSITLPSGTLVDVDLVGGEGKVALAKRIRVLATPGSTFVFAGAISALDVHAGKLVVLDPRDSQSYPITFGPSLAAKAHQLHQGSHVKVSTTFDGKGYAANEIAIQ